MRLLVRILSRLKTLHATSMVMCNRRLKPIYDAVEGDTQALISLIGRVEGTQGVMSFGNYYR